MAKKLYAHKRVKLPTKDRRNYDRQAKHKPIERYQAEKTTKKQKKMTAVADANERQYGNALQQLPQATLTSNKNPLKKLQFIDEPVTIKQDQASKQVINTIRETPPEMYTPSQLLIAPQDKLSLFRKTYS